MKFDNIHCTHRGLFGKVEYKIFCLTFLNIRYKYIFVSYFLNIHKLCSCQLWRTQWMRHTKSFPKAFILLETCHEICQASSRVMLGDLNKTVSMFLSELLCISKLPFFEKRAMSWNSTLFIPLVTKVLFLSRFLFYLT